MNMVSQHPVHLQFAREETMLRITLDRPEARNALSAGMVSAIIRALQDHPQHRVVLDARGSAFCAGGDLAAPPPLSDMEDCVRALATHPGGVIAVVQGPAIGAGLHIALAADFVIAAADACIAFPAARLKLVPPPYLLRRMVMQLGPEVCKRLLVLGEKIACAQMSACAWQIVDPADFHAAGEQSVKAILRELTPAATALLRAIKEQAS